MRKALARRIARVHVITADAMIDRLGPHAANDRQLVGELESAYDSFTYGYLFVAATLLIGGLLTLCIRISRQPQIGR